MKRIIMLLVALLLAFAAAVPVSANPPEFFSVDYDNTFDVGVCGGGQVISDHVVGAIRGTVFYAQDGSAIKVIQRNQGVDSLYSDATPGKVASGNFAHTWTYDPVTYEGTVQGILWNTTLPSYGGVFEFKGRAYSDGRMNGNRQIDPEDFQVLCLWFFGP